MTRRRYFVLAFSVLGLASCGMAYADGAPKGCPLTGEILSSSGPVYSQWLGKEYLANVFFGGGDIYQFDLPTRIKNDKGVYRWIHENGKYKVVGNEVQCIVSEAYYSSGPLERLKVPVPPGRVRPLDAMPVMIAHDRVEVTGAKGMRRVMFLFLVDGKQVLRIDGMDLRKNFNQE